MVTVHVPEAAVQAPDQPVKALPAVGVAVSVTAVPELNEAEQVEPQLMPAGEDATEPFPVLVTERAKVGMTEAVNVADIV